MMKRKRFEMFVSVLLLATCLRVSGTQTMACECQTVTANVTYPKAWFLAYDPENPDTMAPDSDETINIFGCRPPFTWLVSGNGFNLYWYETEGLFNILTADVTGCGTAEITVTDNYGESVTGHMRSTTGRWVECYHSGLIAGCSGSHCGKGYTKEGHNIRYATCRPGWGGDGVCFEAYCDDGWGGTHCPYVEDPPPNCGTYERLFILCIDKWICP
jgi:hypothetical protein